MKNFARITAAVLLIASCSPPKLQQYATSGDMSSKAKYDFNKTIIRENGKGFAVDAKKLPGMPKRIALVSFYVDDPGITKVSGTNSTGKSYTTTNTGSDNAKLFASRFMQNSVDTLRKVFAKYGSTLLTPDEFLSDSAKADFYKRFVVRHTELNKIGQGVMGYLKNSGSAGTSIETDEAAEGYQLVKINKRDMADDKKKAVGANNLASSIDGDMLESIGRDLADSLGVDAVLIVYNSQLADEHWGKTRFWLSAVNMQLLGPNPLPLQEGKKDNNRYNKGLFYCGVRMAFKKGLLINPKTKEESQKDAIEKANEVAYRKMAAGCASRICMYMQDGLNKK